MRTFALVAAALAVALTTGCKDRDRDDAGSRVDATADRAGDEVREGANDVGNAADTAADKVGDAARDVGTPPRTRRARATGTWTWERRDEYRQEARERLAAAGPAARRRAQERQPRRHGGVHQGRRRRPRDPDAVGRRPRPPRQGHRSNWNELETSFVRRSIRSTVRSRHSSLTRSRWEAPARAESTSWRAASPRASSLPPVRRQEPLALGGDPPCGRHRLRHRLIPRGSSS